MTSGLDSNKLEFPGSYYVKGYRALAVLSGDLYASRGYHLYKSSDAGRSFQHIANYEPGAIELQATRLRLASRLFRIGFHALYRLANGALIGIVRKAIIAKRDKEDGFRVVFRIPRGSRPINLCISETGKIYFGEYFSNPERVPVHIYGSEDGENWSVVYEFPSGSIRHIHGLIYDKYRDGIWVLTGDDGHESGLWFTGDEFRTLQPVMTGRQNARAVSLIPCEGGLIVPMDSPLTVNYIQFLDLETMKFEPLQELPGSSFHAVSVDDLMIVSTVIEPSYINKAKHVSVYASNGGIKWKCIARHMRDYNYFPFAMKYLQYPNISLLAGSDKNGFIYGNGIAVKDHDGCIMRWSANDIEKYLNSDAI